MRRVSIYDKSVLEEAVLAVKRGGVIVLPTDTVYGIGCDSARPECIERLFAIKRRDPEKAIALLFSSIDMVRSRALISPALERMCAGLWPGAFTAVLPALEGSDPVGARIPNDAFVLELIQRIGRPLAVTSANISGRPAHTRIADVLEDLAGDERIDLVIDGGDLPESAASTVVDFTVRPPRIMREGPIERTHLERLFATI